MAKLKPGYINPLEMLETLCQIFPGFRKQWEHDTIDQTAEDLDPTYHRILMSFTPDFRTHMR